MPSLTRELDHLSAQERAERLVGLLLAGAGPDRSPEEPDWVYSSILDRLDGQTKLGCVVINFGHVRFATITTAFL
jgi:hypothetical protein